MSEDVSDGFDPLVLDKAKEVKFIDCPLCENTGYYSFQQETADGRIVPRECVCTACTYHSKDGRHFVFPSDVEVK